MSLMGVGLLLIIGLQVAGCGSATVTPTRRATGTLPKPDRVLVYDFAVTPDDVSLDRGIGTKAMRGSGSAAQTAEEIRIGRTVAQALSKNLVKELRNLGINAHHASQARPPKNTTASIKGRFLRIDQGNRTARTMVGFGLGGSQGG